MLKAAGLAVLAVAVAAVAGVAVARDEPSVAVQPVRTTVATPTPVVKPKAKPVVKPSPSTTIDLSLQGLAAANKLYGAGKVPAVRCVLPAAAPETKAELLAYARVMVACMDRAWAPLVDRSQAVFFPVKTVQAYDLKKPAAAPECGDAPKNMDAFYDKGTICFEWPEFSDPDEPVWNLVDFQQLIAHEYGHHVQNSTGILATYDAGWWKQPKAVQLENERRLELQASCLGAAFLGANRTSFKLAGERLRIWKSIVRHVGDENNTLKIRDHGSYKSHAYWTTRAFASTNPATCNTFTAAPKRVS
ncbi:neutral zinc metallopeptidase [Kribbella sp. NPDC056951]|uniref:neutral zinc metallopeptidase n=1 Tax=Kribbella sp. NPDC056951 TaxID=3345978 RepID=UPI003630D120